MTGKDLKRAGFLVMLVMLVSTAPQWLLNPANQHRSNYDAPWIYPGLAPEAETK